MASLDMEPLFTNLSLEEIVKNCVSDTRHENEQFSRSELKHYFNFVTKRFFLFLTMP